jgi:hypothetical protein
MLENFWQGIVMLNVVVAGESKVVLNKGWRSLECLVASEILYFYQHYVLFLIFLYIVIRVPCYLRNVCPTVSEREVVQACAVCVVIPRSCANVLFF